MTLIEILKSERQRVIGSYEKSRKEISLKEYMNIVLSYFDEHSCIAKKTIKSFECGDVYIVCRYIDEACKVADRKASVKFRNEFNMERAKRLNATGWYIKNYR